MAKKPTSISAQPSASEVPGMSAEHAARLEGAALAFGIVSADTRVKQLAALHVIKEQKLYRSLWGYRSWEEYCLAKLGRSISSIDEEVQNYRAFGEHLLSAMFQAGAPRQLLRDMRELPEPERPKRLSLGMWEVGTERIDTTGPDGMDRLVEALERRIAFHRNVAEDATAKIAESTQQLEAKDAEIERLGEKLKEKKEREAKAERYAELKAHATGEITRGLFVCATTLAQLGERVRTERPDPAEVLGAVRLLSPLVRDLLEYASDRRKVILEAPELDPELLDQVSREMAEREAAEDAEWEHDEDEAED